MPVGWYVVEPPTSGVLVATKTPTRAQMFGQLPTIGALTLVVPKLSMAAQGKFPYVGALTAQAAKAVASMIGSQVVGATMGATLADATAQMSGVSANLASMTMLAAEATAAFNGISEARGALVAAAKAASANLAGAQEQTGALSASVQKVQAIFADGTAIGYGGIIQLAKAQAALSGFQGQTGVVAAALKPTTAELNGFEHPRGTIAAVDAVAQFSANGGQAQVGSFVAALKKAQAAFVGGSEQTGALGASLKKAAFGGSQIALPVAFRSAVAGANINTLSVPSTSTSWTHAALAGDSVLVFASVCTNGGGGIASCTATYGGVAMTSRGSVAANNQPYGTLFVFSLLDVPAGNSTIVVSAATGTGNLTCIEPSSFSYTGVKSFGTAVTAAGVATAPSVTVTNVANGMVCAGFGLPANGASAMNSPSQTQRYNHAPLATNTDTAVLVQDSSTVGSLYFGAAAAFGSWCGVIGIPMLNTI